MMEDKRGETINNSSVSVNATALLKDTIVKKINYYTQKSYITDKDVYTIFKEFFTEFLQLKYEFTCSELLHELKRVFMDNATMDRTVSLINGFKLIEFQQDAYSQDELKSMLAKLRNLVVDLIDSNVKAEKHSILDSIFKHKSEPEVPAYITNDSDEALDFPDIKTEELEDTTKQENILVEKAIKKEKELKESEEKLNLDSKEEFPELDDENLEKEISDLAPDNLNLDEDIPTDDIDWGGTDLHEEKISKKDEDKPINEKVDLTQEPKDINKLISDSKKIKSKSKLKEMYKEIMLAYNLLSEEEQDEVYDDVNKVYLKIK